MTRFADGDLQPAPLSADDLGVMDIEAIRLILRGGSVVNWPRLNFNDPDEVAAFLRVNEYDVESQDDADRLRYLIRSSADYIRRTFGYDFPTELTEPRAIEDVFLRSSSRDPLQKLACMILKVAHVLNHLQGRELRYMLPVSDQALFSLAEDKVSACVDSMKARGIPIADYQSSRKSRDSLITKLLSKRRTIAAQIFDKLRFRIVTETQADIVPVLSTLTRQLIPFNYVIPDESRNDILSLNDLVSDHPRLRAQIGHLHVDLRLDERLRTVWPAEAHEDYPPNPFSADGYRVINFVIDLPVRVDALLRELGGKAPSHLGKLVFVLVEFQVFDRSTFEQNEKGNASHAYYKKRQRQMVLQRLVRGMPLYLRSEPDPARSGLGTGGTASRAQVRELPRRDGPDGFDGPDGHDGSDGSDASGDEGGR